MRKHGAYMDGIITANYINRGIKFLVILRSLCFNIVTGKGWFVLIGKNKGGECFAFF